jgi:HAD superfamily hydrolase (TIGR01490 family)
MNGRIAFFDFDGTITTSDTLLDFIRFSKGPIPFLFGFLVNSPWLVAYRLKIISNQHAKQRILSWFFRNTPLADFQRVCDRFASETLPGLIRPKALQEITLLREKGFSVVIVSASPENWLRQWTEKIGTSLLATRLESNHFRLTGRILGNNCHGAEKVRRIRESYNLSDYDEVYAYGDTKGDKPMLALAARSFYKPFR